jgi:hypothetical protein
MQHLQPGVPHITEDMAREFELPADSSFAKTVQEIAARPSKKKAEDQE